MSSRTVYSGIDTEPSGGGGVLAGIRRAVRYAREGLRLLLQRPSLLLVAVAMGVLGTVDHRVGTYIACAHTGWGRDTRQLMDQGRAVRPESRARITILAKAYGDLLVVMPPAPGVGFHGTIQVLWAAAYGKSGKLSKPEPGHPYGRVKGFAGLHGALTPLMLLAGLLIGSFTCAGYLVVARDTVLRGLPRWRVFFSEARRFYIRLTLFTLGLLVVSTPVAVVGAFTDHGALGVYAVAPFLFLLALTQYAIIADDIGVFAAMRRSVRTIIGNLPVAVVLILGAGFLGWAGHQLDPWSSGLPTEQGLIADPFPTLPRAVVSACLMFALGAWFSLVAFSWYRDAAPSPAWSQDPSEQGEANEGDPDRSNGTPS